MYEALATVSKVLLALVIGLGHHLEKMHGSPNCEGCKKEDNNKIRGKGKQI